MATRTLTVLIDDIDGKEADQTVPFALDGVNYEIDLSGTNAELLREAFAPYIEAGRKAARVPRSGGRSSSAGTVSNSARLRAIREWAGQNGYEISDRGRIPAKVIKAYDQQAG